MCRYSREEGGAWGIEQANMDEGEWERGHARSSDAAHHLTVGKTARVPKQHKRHAQHVQRDP